MKRSTQAVLWVVAGALAAATVATAGEVTLYQVTVPERRTLEVPMVATAQAPQADMTAEMSFREGQATIEIRYKDMKPAVLLGGDITSYVLWAIARDGAFENLGELKVRDDSDKLEFTSGLKAFSLLVTAETYPRVSRPSALVMFASGAPKKEKKYPAEAFVFSGLGPTPTVGVRSLAGIAWDRSANLDVVQAERIVDLASQAGATQRTPDLSQEMQTALGQARNYNRRSRDRSTTDYAGRAVALASESLQIIRRQNEAAELERQIAARKAEMAALEKRASAAEQQATAAQQQAEAARQQAAASQQQAMTAQQQLDLATQQKAEAAAAITAAQAELTRLADEKTRLEQSVAEESARAEKLKQEKEELSSRLQGALSRVAETTSTARGLIVNLPDILFDLNQATLKPGAREVIAKLSGILLMMPELNLRIEGHTDSTGSREYNQTLSEKRALSVQDFLMSQGIDSKRITAVGYGWDRPVADNSTAEGRSKNRRVEIVIGEGTIQEAPAPAK
jgi:outer membrane protein OmpA-like peptidoglycan-associated protein